MRASSLALGVALAAGATSAADAQTVISREISTQPVETVVTHGPYGTTITRRPLAPNELADTYAPGSFVQQPLNLAPSYEPSFRPPGAIPQVVSQPAPVVAEEEAPAVERVTTRTVVREPVRTQSRTVERTVQRPVRAAAAPIARGRDVPILAKGEVLPPRRAARVNRVALTAAEKRIVYRTITRERVVSQPVRRDVVTTTVAPALPPPAYVERRYDVPTTAYVERRYEQPWWERRWEQPVYNTATYQNGYTNNYTNTWRAPVVAADDEAVVTTPVVARGPAYAIGAMLPAGVPLYGVPESLAFRVPALRPYRYAYLGEQVYLVDPLSNVIVAVVTE
jgi:hypothetical protein